MQQSIDKLPAYLRRYCAVQPDDKYTARDQAAWRYIMRQSGRYFKDHAVAIYQEGLAKTGISLERIPRIRDMDQAMQRLGWGAVPVEGFIPPAAFLEFQARRILPIACDMRSVEHLHYTPAPDIVHEAAGHAPIIADPAYSEYLTMYAAMAQRAIFAQEDLDVYEAIRTLSDVKENPDCSDAMVEAAEAALVRANAAVTTTSEANKVARMNWWTVEYGLLGSLADPRIYGAGLLSSVSESQACLSPRITKHRLTTACIETTYKITEPQPQLFVAEDIPHLVQVLKEFEATLSYKRGGVYGLEQARAGRTVTTTVLDSGLEISGLLTGLRQSQGGAVEFLQWGKAVQLAHAGNELAGQGVAQHPSGFSSPLGRLSSRLDQPLTRLSDSELEACGVRRGQRATLAFSSGYTVEGEVVQLLRVDGSLQIIKWRDCTVTKGSEVLFQPSWGDFDMAVGELVKSVYGGPSDRERYGSLEIGTATTSPGRTSPFTAHELAAFRAYQEVRSVREADRRQVAEAKRLADRMEQTFPAEWLLRLETIELLGRAGPSEAESYAQRLGAAAQGLDADVQWLVRQGLAAAVDQH